MKYTVVLQRTEEGYSVGCPGLPGCWSQGATEQEALENIQAAIQEYLAAVRDSLQGGEIREVELATAEGPYLPVGSSIHVRIEWTDKKGDTEVVRTPDESIRRTD